MNKTEKSKARVIIDEFLTGKLPDDLQMRIGDWIDRLQVGDDCEEALQNVFDEYAAKYSTPDLRTARAWKKRCVEMDLSDSRGRRMLLHKRLMRVAAVLIPLLVAGTGLILFDNLRETTQEVRSYTLVNASEGTRKVIGLPCGTEIILSAGSEITYDETGYMSRRHVRLDGEAYFSVAPYEGESFVVEAGDVRVTVLGTEFNVRAQLDNQQTEVSLFSGSVEVTALGTDRILKPRQQLVYDKISGTASVKDFDTEEVGGWRNALSLENVRMEEAFHMIGNHFGVTVVTDDSIPRGKIIRAKYRNGTLTEVLDTLKDADEDFAYEITGDTVYITGR